MPRAFGNCDYRFDTPKGKPVFVPSAEGRKVGSELKSKIEAVFIPAPYFYHLVTGGHIRALHDHRNNNFFAKIDLENFFYSIGRNRAAHSLQELGFNRAESKFYSKWSTVRNPYGRPSYSLPYGFIQSDPAPNFYPALRRAWRFILPSWAVNAKGFCVELSDWLGAKPLCDAA